jgi:phosphoribosylglycinamide formyltransferase 1
MIPDSSARLVVLLSGRGSNFEALHMASQRSGFNGRIAGVISDRPQAHGLTLARHFNIDAVCVDRTRHADRQTFEASLTTTIEGFEPDYIIMAGFMRVLSAGFVAGHAGRMINIHPSLLPKYRGLNTHQRALEAGDAEHGASVHFVTPELDGGPILSRVRMPIRSDDTAESLARRLLHLEHRLLPASVALLLKSPVVVRDEGIYLDHKKLDHPLELGRDLDVDGLLISHRQPDPN